MRLIKVAGAALNQTPMAWDDNRAHIIAAIEQARQAAVAILCLPELCVSGYGCEDAFCAAGTHKRSLESLLQIVPHTVGIAVSVGLPIFHETGLFNASCLIVDGRIIGFSCKQFLANEGLHYEPRWFKPWPQGKVSRIELFGQSCPIGELCYALGDVLLGFEVCEDAWAADRPGRRLVQAGVDIILNPSASHFAFEKFEIRKRFVIEGSRAFGCGYIYANHNGNESGRAIYDGGTLIANAGQLLVAGPRFSFKDVVLTEAVLDVELGRLARARSAQAAEETLKKQSAPLIIRDSLWIPAHCSEMQTRSAAKGWETQTKVKEEEFTRAVSLALFDYLRKSFSRGYVLSLSGGADSASVACLVRYSFQLALIDLGADGLREKLSYCVAPGGSNELEAVVKRFLTTVYQSSANSSELTRSAAAKVATAVGSKHHEISVASIVENYTGLVESSFGRTLDWQQDDLALQNIQARARGPVVWMFANLNQALLLATSNRSEAAVGYTTMDGDTCGSISPIAGIDKAFLRQWLRWVENVGPDGLGPIPEVAAVNSQEPTAELRPTAQTDEADLMPYGALEFIERAAIRDKKDPSEILEHLKTQFPKVSNSERLRWVKLFFTLWSKSQWKRERYAPAFHLDDESLDPKTWCRFPILSGSYKKELSELADI